MHKYYHPKRKRAAISRACYITTAVLNGLALPAYCQTAFSDKGPDATPLRYGPFDVFYGLKGNVMYDDNIYISSTNKQSDVLWTIAPNVAVGSGDYREQEESFFNITYTPSIILFTDQTSNNALDHEVFLKAQWRPAAWRFGLQQGYQNLSGSVVDVGNRVDRDVYTTGLEGTYEVSPRTSFELAAHQSINHYESTSLRSYNEWTVAGWMDYEIMPLLKAGAGVTGGWVDVRQGANQTYQQGLVRLTYSLTELMDLRASGGGEVREFQGNEPNRATPVFSLGATYRPLENTTLKLDAYRHSQASIVLQNDQNYTVTGFSGGVRQIFLENYSANLTGGYEHSHYNSNSGGAANRQDDYFFVQAGVDWNVLDRLTVGLFYQYRNNDSTDATHGFDNHQVGLNVNFRF